MLFVPQHPAPLVWHCSSMCVGPWCFHCQTARGIRCACCDSAFRLCVFIRLCHRLRRGDALCLLFLRQRKGTHVALYSIVLVLLRKPVILFHVVRRGAYRRTQSGRRDPGFRPVLFCTLVGLRYKKSPAIYKITGLFILFIPIRSIACRIPQRNLQHNKLQGCLHRILHGSKRIHSVLL